MTSEPVAIVGIGCLFPGAASPDELWRNLLDGRDSTSLAGESDLAVDPTEVFDSRTGERDRTYFLRGGYVRDFSLDPRGFAIGPEQVEALDDVARWSLYVAREALLDAARLGPDALARCGLVLGSLSFPTRESQAAHGPLYHRAVESALNELLLRDDVRLRDKPSAGPTALKAPSPASAVARALGLGGPTLCIDAACASSLYAVKLAADYLGAGKADLMLAGAVSCADPFFVNMGFSIFHAYPDDGTASRPLDRSSRGLVSGEGAGVFVLKRHADALRDGDRIHAVVRGVGLSNDGRGKHLLTPNPKGQVVAFERAYRAAEVAPASVPYVECHATGTPLGDPIELDSMARFFGADGGRPRVGSVKSNFGHMLTAAGMAGMTKAILAMQHGLIPPTIGVADPVVSSDGTVGGEGVVRAVIDWPAVDGPRRAGVSAFGFGGTNAHLVLEQPAPSSGPDSRRIPAPSAAPAALTPLAIVGMSAHVGAASGLDELDRIFRDGASLLRPPPLKRRKGLLADQSPGAYIESLEVDFLRYRIPPSETDQPIPQQLVLLKAADEAARDAGLVEGANVAVIVAMDGELELHQYRGRVELGWLVRDALAAAGVDLSPGEIAELAEIAKDSVLGAAQVNQYVSFIGNIMAARVAQLWDFSGPAFTVSAGDASSFRALEVAQLMLSRGEVDAVVVGAVDLLGSAERALLRADDEPLGDGAVAVVLKRADQVDAAGDRLQGTLDAAVDVPGDHSYATIEGFAIARGIEPAHAAARAAREALAAAGATSDEIGYLEVQAASAGQAAAEAAGLAIGYEVRQALTVGSARSAVGHLGAAAGLVAVVRAALCLSGGYLPPGLDGAPARPWTTERRLAGVSGLAADGTAAHVVLADSASSAFLFPLGQGQDQGVLPGRGARGRPLPEGEGTPAVPRSHVRRVELGGTPIRDRIVTPENIARFRPAVAPSFVTSTPAGVPAPPAPASASPELPHTAPAAPIATAPVRTAATTVPSAAPTPAIAARPPTAPPAARIAASAPPLPVMSPPATAATPTSSASAAPPTVTLLEREPSWQTSAHRAFLDARAAATRHAGAAIGWQMELAQRAAAGDGSGRGAGGAGAHEPPGAGPAPTSTRPVWNEGDLLEFAQGSIARVFGPAYAPIDQYHRRVRLPMPPYLLVSRVTRLDAERGEFRPSTMTTEYDIPPGAWYSVDGQIPWAVAVESGQCDLLLISYIGIDFECRGERVYRLLDCTLTFLDRLPREGKTLRYDITIDSYARSGDNLLFFFRYDCFVDDRLVLTMRGGCAGFFSDQELERGRGVIYSDAEIAARARIEPRHFVPPLTCQRRSFDERDLAALSAGDPRSVFGAAWEPHGLNRSLRLPPEAMRMFDRVVSVDPTGGAYGLGALVAEKDLRPDDWYFPCHFKADEVLAGSLMADGCVQLMQLYLLFLGSQTRTENARFQPIPGLPQVVRCRGQVTPRHSRLTYRMEITDLGLDPLPYARADVEIVVDGKIVVHFKDLGLQLEEAPDGRRPPPIAVRPALLDERHVDAFATGRMADCFGPEYAIYDRRAVSRQPNDDLQLISRVVEVQATRHDLSPGSSLTSEYDVPADPWFYRENAAPEVPYSMLMEIALQPCGFLSAWLGSTLPFPDEEFHFRNLDGQGRLLRNLDLRGRTIVNRARLRSSTTIQGVVLQSFDFELSCDGEPFYVGDASFGHFATATLANQVGLDAGRPSPSWLVEHPDADVVELDPRALERAPAGRPHYRLPAGRLDLLDRVAVVEHGGRHGRGYVFASHPVDPTDWFYACHFYQDPVMPGSLGVEAIAEALQALALRLDLGGAFQSPRFGHPSDHLTVWKYRGQIVPGNGAMSLEAHVKRIDRAADRVTIVADASLWRDDLRIYEVTDLALTIEEG